MGYSVKARLSASFEATIEIRSSTVFATSAWSLESFDPENPLSVPLLYSFAQSGNGVLSNGGKTLTISLDVCPLDDFRITAGSFRKIFNLTEGKLAVGSKVVAANNLRWSKTYNSSQFGTPQAGTIEMGLVFFNSKKIPTTTGGGYSARLYQGDKLRCFVFGNAFEQVYRNDPSDPRDGQFWLYSGVLFNKFGWIGRPPVDVQDYALVLEVGSRGSGDSELIFDVQLSAAAAVGPLSSVYDVHSGDTFVLDDGYLQ
jgi:hypothetical protein